MDWTEASLSNIILLPSSVHFLCVTVCKTACISGSIYPAWWSCLSPLRGAYSTKMKHWWWRKKSPLATKDGEGMSMLIKKWSSWGTWVAQLVEHLPLAQIVISGSWDWAPHWAPGSAESLFLPLLLPLPPPTCAVSLSLSNEINKNLQKKFSSQEQKL